MRQIGCWDLKVKASGAIVKGQIWIKEGKIQVYVDHNWYPIEAFERAN